MLITLERSDGIQIEITLPDNASELTLSQKLDFDFAQMGVISFLKKYENELFEKRGEYLILIAKGLSEVLQLDLSELMNLNGLNLLQISYEDIINHVNGFGEKGLKGLNKNQLETNLLALWNYFNQVINSADAKGKTSITYKDQTFELPKLIQTATGREIHKSLTVKQAIEIIQVNNRYHANLKSNPDLKETETDKSWLFTKYLTEIPLLLKPNEIPLESQDQFDVWLKGQIVFFSDIDWQTVLILDNWFNDYIEELKKDPENKYFFESAYEARTQEERDAENKARAKGEKIYRNIGMRGIIPALFEMGIFDKPNKSKMESTMNAPFTDAVKYISSSNASK